MRKLLQRLLAKPVIWLANKWSSHPDKARVFKALTDLHQDILNGNTKKGLIISFDIHKDKFIVLSDQHKGAKNDSDDFMLAEKNYLAALEYYYQNDYFFINLGDCEELWENTWAPVKKSNTASFEKEKLFVQKSKYIKIFGNHDLYWGNDILTAPAELKSIYGQSVTIYEGIILQTQINDHSFQVLLTHGHQGDLQSDGNWFSKWFVSNVWAKLQAYLCIHPDTPAYDTQLKTVHNTMMYEWSSDNDVALITGHTHQPVFESLTLLERLYSKLAEAIKVKDEKKIADIQAHIHHRFAKGEVLPDFTGFKPNYFNSGCCCFSDGDITGIEISDSCIRLVKWEYNNDNIPQRIVLEEAMLGTIAVQAKAPVA
jgi:predicted phosphodiesterase